MAKPIRSPIRRIVSGSSLAPFCGIHDTYLRGANLPRKRAPAQERSPSQAVAWVLQNDNVASAITGGSRPQQVADNAAAAGKVLSKETLAGIDTALGDAVERDGSLFGSTSPKNLTGSLVRHVVTFSVPIGSPLT